MVFTQGAMDKADSLSQLLWEAEPHKPKRDSCRRSSEPVSSAWRALFPGAEPALHSQALVYTYDGVGSEEGGSIVSEKWLRSCHIFATLLP